MVDYRGIQWQPSGGYEGPLGTMEWAKSLPPLPGLTTRTVQSVPIDPLTGNPIAINPRDPGFYDPSLNRAGEDAFYEVAPDGSTYRNNPAPLPQPASRYSGLDTIDPLNINNLGLTRQSFFAKQETPAERAIAEVTIRGGMNSPTGGIGRGRRTLPRLPTMPDPLAEALAIGKSYKPSAKVQAALGAPAPPGSPGAPSGRGGGGLLSMLLGGFGGGSGGQGGGLASLLGGPATGQQLASMQQAAQTAQDPALAIALAAGNKSYTPTNGDPTGVLGYGALMPTVAMNGNPIRNR